MADLELNIKQLSQLLNFDNKEYADAKKLCEESINFKF